MNYIQSNIAVSDICPIMYYPYISSTQQTRFFARCGILIRTSSTRILRSKLVAKNTFSQNIRSNEKKKLLPRTIECVFLLHLHALVERSICCLIRWIIISVHGLLKIKQKLTERNNHDLLNKVTASQWVKNHFRVAFKLLQVQIEFLRQT